MNALKTVVTAVALLAAASVTHAQTATVNSGNGSTVDITQSTTVAPPPGEYLLGVIFKGLIQKNTRDSGRTFQQPSWKCSTGREWRHMRNYENFYEGDLCEVAGYEGVVEFF